jgi:hypothetical protein
MRDEGLAMLLNAIFGVGGITILILAWIQSMPVSDRIFTTFIGLIGLSWVLIPALLLRFTPTDR